MTIQAKRQSTTSKITRALALLIHTHTRIGDGVIVRHHGTEYGVNSVHYCLRTKQFLFDTLEGVTLSATACTMRKSLPAASDRQAVAA